MADTQSAVVKSGYGEAPHVVSDDNSMQEAEEAILKMLVPETETPESEEAEPTEEEESQPEEEDESLEEEPEESEELDDEGADNRAEEGEDLYAVTVNGEEHTVPLDELLKGYSRQSDYTKKTQELSQQRREMETLQEQWGSEVARIQAERQHYINSLESAVQSSIGQLDQFANINWDQLKEDNPLEFITKRDEYREAQEQIRQYQGHQAQAAQEQQATHARMVQEEQGKLVEILPDWGKASQRRAIGEEIKAYAISEGYSPEEIRGLVDHRNFLTLYKAMKYDKASSPEVVKKKVKNKPRVIRSGRGADNRDAEKSQRAEQMKRLKQTGHVDDAASLLEDMFNS